MKLQADKAICMMFSVPQFIDVEDKVAGPLTWKQLGWMIGMGAIILTLFAIFDTGLAIILTLPVVLIFCALAFYKPNGFPLLMFLGSGIFFLFRPKIAVWERPTALPTKKAQPVHEHHEEVPAGDKELTREKISALAQMIDRR